MSEFRLAREEDLPQIMTIIAEAQAFLASCGVNQWQDGYPDEAVMRGDMRLGQGYVLTEGDMVLGIATVTFAGEPTYDVIYDGAWTTPEPFACIHRTAISAGRRGTGSADALMQAAEALVRARGVPSIRIDTHRENLVMQRMLARNGYSQCGVIYLESGAERIALEKRV